MLIDRPIEQAFALIGYHGLCGAGRTVNAGIHQAAHKDEAAVDAWIAIGECVNRIAAAATAH